MTKYLEGGLPAYSLAQNDTVWTEITGTACPFYGVIHQVNQSFRLGQKKKLVTFHEQKPIDYLITKTYTVTNI